MFDQLEITHYGELGHPTRLTIPMGEATSLGTEELGDRNATIRINGVLYSICAKRRRFMEINGPGKVTEDGTVLDDDGQEFFLVPWRIHQRIASEKFEEENAEVDDTTPEGGDDVVVEPSNDEDEAKPQEG